MLSKVKQRLTEEVLENKVQYLLIVFFLVVGITSGTYAVSNFGNEGKQELAKYSQSVLIAIKMDTADYLSVFFYAWLQNTIVFVLIAAFSLLMIGLPVVAAIMVFKGFCVGFTVGVLSLGLTTSGFAAAVFATLLPNLILLPCICKAGVLGFSHTVLVIRSRHTPKTTQDRLVMAQPLFRKLLGVYGVAMIGVVLQTLLSPMLLQSI